MPPDSACRYYPRDLIVRVPGSGTVAGPVLDDVSLHHGTRPDQLLDHGTLRPVLHRAEDRQSTHRLGAQADGRLDRPLGRLTARPGDDSTGLPGGGGGLGDCDHVRPRGCPGLIFGAGGVAAPPASSHSTARPARLDARSTTRRAARTPGPPGRPLGPGRRRPVPMTLPKPAGGDLHDNIMEVASDQHIPISRAYPAKLPTGTPFDTFTEARRGKVGASYPDPPAGPARRTPARRRTRPGPAPAGG